MRRTKAAQERLARERGVGLANDVEFIIKSFRRFGSLLRLVNSIKLHYPDARILVADDSFENVPEPLPPEAEAVKRMPGVTWFQLPFDTGLGAGRNLMVQKATAPFIVNCDDDFVFTSETRVEHFIRVLRSDPSVSLVGGLVRGEDGQATNWCGHFRFEGARPSRQLSIEPLHSPWQYTGGVWYRQSDLALNFFAAPRETLLKYPWDPQFKIVGEHLDHFLAIHAGGARVVYTPSVICGHIHDHVEGYVQFRRRMEFFRPLLAKWGLVKPPNHPAIPEPHVPRRSVPHLIATEAAKKPNVILFGVGHSGTSIATRMLHALGWHAGDADEEFAESISVRAVNEAAIYQFFDEDAARAVLEKLPQPWALKDPRFVHTMDKWLPLFADYEPVLVWLVRDSEAVVESYRRRGERVRFGMSVEEAVELASKVYASWPWGKVRVGYESLWNAARIFDAERVQNTQS